MDIRIKKLDPRAVTPERATKGSAGYDLTCTNITTEINECGQLVLVYHTGLAFEIPEGYEGQIRPRSSIYRKSLRLVNSPGTIDSDYRGEVIAKFVSTTDVVPAVYREGERFAQLIIQRVEDVTFIESDELSKTERGEDGFGSTDVKDESSAAKGPQSPSEEKDESINSETSNEPAAGDESAPEQV